MKHLNLLSTIVLLFIINTIDAQVIKISTFSQEGIVMGDIVKQEINSNSAGYVDYGSVGGLEVAYYSKNKIGVGLRWSGTYYGRDIETYESDLTEMLGISNDLYDITQLHGFWSFGSDIGISYLLDLSEKWQLEPYFYIGLQALLSPTSAVVYSENNTTYQYVSKSQIYFGARYSPGAKLHWNPFRHVGFFFSLEWDGKSFLYDDERSMIYSYNTLSITDMEKNYRFQSVNFGLGLTFRFGKGLSQL